MFSLTDINSDIYDRIKSYSNLEAASKLTSWIRVFSGADGGLILQSNTDYKLVRAVGDTTATIYGDAENSGTVGKDFQGNVISTTGDRVLRPSPIITGFSSKEGMDQISREGTLQLKAFTLAQLEEIQKYFLEPGYTLFVEMGWNTDKGISQYTKTTNDKGEKLSNQTIVNSISKKSLNISNLRDTRIKSLGEYDAFLGFIVGGSVSSDGDNFNISVSLRGQPSIPSSLQSYRNSQTIDTTNGKLNGSSNTDKSKNTFSPSELEDTAGLSTTQRRFRYMFNELPSSKQLDSIKALESSVNSVQFINFDRAIEHHISEYVNKKTGTNWFGFGGTNSTKIPVTISNNTIQIDVEREKLVPRHKYIRMDLAMRIINTISSDSEFKSGENTIPIQINIDTSKIGAFPGMFSTNPEKLLIPGKVPDFHSAYFLKGENVIQNSDGTLTPDSTTTPLPMIIPDSSLVSFANNSESTGDYYEKAEYWGYLRNLFINFELFKSIIDKKILNTRDVVLQLLNEISSAVNAHWKFQIIEKGYQQTQVPADFNSVTKVPNVGDTYLTVVDENFIGEPDVFAEIREFDHSGTKSIFRSANLDIQIPSAMTGMIVSERLGQTIAPDAPVIKTASTFFNSTKDLFVNIVTNNTPSPPPSGSGTTSSSGKTAEELQQEINTKYRLDVTKSTGIEIQTLYRIDVNPELKVKTTLITYGKGGGVNEVVENQLYLTEYENLQTTYSTAFKNEKTNVTTTIQSNIDKCDVVVKVGTTVNTYDPSKGSSFNDERYIDDFKKYLAIATYRDSEFLDLLKNGKIREKEKSLSILLPIKYSFTILGNSGIRRGDMFKINGISKKYSDNGLFQVVEIENQLNQSSWETTITGQYRQIQ